jgi:sterol desaturase/sphingolipid hydroxylase (fatty acid hydroxylase superfamily)
VICSVPGVSGPGGDHLTAPDGAIARRDPAGRLTLADCFRAFAAYTSPRLIALAFAAALAARVAAGHWDWRDPLIALALVAAQPFTEWLIHVYLLHSRPVRFAGRRFDLPAAREHREHHEAPAELGGVLIPTYVIVIAIPLIALVAIGAGYALNPLVGGDRLAGTLTGIVAAYAILGGYEWCHYLIHSPYVPRGRHYSKIRRSHRLHHYKNERYWFGVTSNLGDRVIGTNPDAAEVPRSPTARNLREALERSSAGSST